MIALLSSHEIIALASQKHCSGIAKTTPCGTKWPGGRPQRGLMCVTAGLDLRGDKTNTWLRPQRGSHNKNNGAIVRHLRSRSLHSYTYRRSRPAVKHSVTPLGSFLRGIPAIKHSVTPLGSFCEESWASRSYFEKKWPYSCVIQEF